MPGAGSYASRSLGCGCLAFLTALAAAVIISLLPGRRPSPPSPEPPSPTPAPDAYRDRVGSLSRFERRETEWTYTMTYGFIDHQGQVQEVTCDISRLDHDREVTTYGYDETEYYAARDPLVREEIAREMGARGLDGLVTVTVERGRWESSYQLPGGMEADEQARRMEDVQRFFRWLKEDFPSREAAIDQHLLAEHGLRLEGDHYTIDHAALAERAARPLADCYRAVERAGRGGSERRLLGLLIAFFQEIRYEVPPDVVGGRRTLGLFVPTEVLTGDHGDCDSKAVAFAAMWRNRDTPLLLIHVPNHMLLGVAVPPGPGERFVRLGNRYFVLCEVAGPGKIHPGRSDVSGAFEYVLLEPAATGTPPQRGEGGA